MATVDVRAGVRACLCCVMWSGGGSSGDGEEAVVMLAAAAAAVNKYSSSSSSEGDGDVKGVRSGCVSEVVWIARHRERAQRGRRRAHD